MTCSPRSTSVHWRRAATGCLGLALAATFGCGTTRSSDTSRTGTEQLLISSAIDQAVGQINVQPLAGRTVYLDTQYVHGSTDEKYLISTLRQHLLANGCILRPTAEAAEYVVEARAGAVGTNRHDVLLGLPATQLPNVPGGFGITGQIPEIPFAKTSDQRGVAKVALFAYHRDTGLPVWQSGAFPVTTTAKNTWILGTGPFQRGSIYDGTRFAGTRLMLPFQKDSGTDYQPRGIPTTAEAVFTPRTQVAMAAQPGASPPAPGAAWPPGAPAPSTGAAPPSAMPPAGGNLPWGPPAAAPQPGPGTPPPTPPWNGPAAAPPSTAPVTPFGARVELLPPVAPVEGRVVRIPETERMATSSDTTWFDALAWPFSGDRGAEGADSPSAESLP